MDDQNEIELWRDHALKAYGRIKANRAYALDAQSTLALTALCRAWQEQRATEGTGFNHDQLVKFLESVAQEIPALLQSRPNDLEKVPEIPVDPITGERAANCYAAGDLESCGIVEERWPTLAKHLKRIAKDKGFTFKHLAEIQDREADRAAAQAVTYTESDHERNVYRQPNKFKQGEFEKANPPEVVEFWKREAQPIRLPFSRASKNLTQLGRIVRDQPDIGKVMLRAEQLETTWLDRQLAEAKQQLADAQQKRQQAEKMLQGQAV